MIVVNRNFHIDFSPAMSLMNILKTLIVMKKRINWKEAFNRNRTITYVIVLLYALTILIILVYLL